MPAVDADELLDNPDVPLEVRKVIKEAVAANRKKPQRRTGFYVVGETPRGTEVQPGKRNYQNGTDHR